MLFETCYYTVEVIDGDYAHLKKVDDDSAELKLEYEMLQYELV